MKEIWKNIEGFDGFYQVSTLGRVKSFKQKKHKLGKILTPYITQKGYACVVFYFRHKYISARINRLVAQAFIPNFKKLSSVNHKDKNKLNNHIDNLEWMSIGDNIRYSIETHVKGEMHAMHKLNNKNIIYIRKLKKHNPTIMYKDIAPLFNVNKSTISRVCNNILWKHVNVE